MEDVMCKRYVASNKNSNSKSFQKKLPNKKYINIDTRMTRQDETRKRVSST